MSLSTFFPDASLPPDGGLADTRGWIESKLKEQAEQGYHAVLDAGGGFTGFSALVEDVPVIEALAAQGTDVIGLFCVGPEQADLDYLDAFSREALFVPDATMIVMNAGLVLSGLSPRSAFAAVSENAAFKAAVGRGAKVAMFPALSCMAEVTDRGLTFEEAAAGRVKPGQVPMSMFDPTRVREWWTKKVPDFFGKFPPTWLPSAHAATTAAKEALRLGTRRSWNVRARGARRNGQRPWSRLEGRRTSRRSSRPCRRLLEPGMSETTSARASSSRLCWGCLAFWGGSIKRLRWSFVRSLRSRATPQRSSWLALRR